MSEQTKYIFIDESGDPSFYGKKKKLLIGNEGFQPLLMLGALVIENKKDIRNRVIDFQEDIKGDILFNLIPSISNNSNWYLHAKDDFPDVRTKFFELIRSIEGVRCNVVLGRKRLQVFQNKHNGLESEFYFDMVHHLLKDIMVDENTKYKLFLASRNNNTIAKFSDVVTKTITSSVSQNIEFQCNIVSSTDTPELSIIDYLLWALQRYILVGEDRYYRALQNKFDLIMDLYDFETKNKGKSTHYRTSVNPFFLEEANEFRKDGYI